MPSLSTSDDFPVPSKGASPYIDLSSAVATSLPSQTPVNSRCK